MIDFINSLPFTAPVDGGHVEMPANIVKGYPSQLNQGLFDKTLDLSFISCSEYLKNKSRYALVSDLCIGAFPEVMSVVLYTKKPLFELDHEVIAITKQSSTSVNLLKILCYHFWKIIPTFTAFDKVEEVTNYSAFLLIGDQSLHYSNFPGYSRIDLCKAWYYATGLPFTFAVLAARNEIVMSHAKAIESCVAKLHESLKWSINNLIEIEKLAEEKSGLASDVIHDYFKILHYQLNAKQKEAINRFESLMLQLPENSSTLTTEALV